MNAVNYIGYELRYGLVGAQTPDPNPTGMQKKPLQQGGLSKLVHHWPPQPATTSPAICARNTNAMATWNLKIWSKVYIRYVLHSMLFICAEVTKVMF